MRSAGAPCLTQPAKAQRLCVRTTMQFDQFADDYQQILDQTLAALGEGSSYFAEYKTRYRSRLHRQHFSGKLLDFGCGVGLLSGFLKKHLPGAQIHRFDISADSRRTSCHPRAQSGQSFDAKDSRALPIR
jgi:2-polyprenyl-3-methyl-5-hydroxy-6-metoxy-1,4-benzoquinol methylase